MKPERKIKLCPFCSEEILADAIKCRYCKEFLDEEESQLPVSHHAVNNPRPRPPVRSTAPQPTARASQKELDGELIVLPSVLGLAGEAMAAVFLLAIAFALMALPFDRWIIGLLSLSDSAASKVDLPVQIIHLIGFIIGLVAVLRLIYQALTLKSVRYVISSDRIEWSRGIFSRRIDNIDMFRVADLKLHRSLLDCLLGIGAVTLMTRDETDPIFRFEKVRNPRKLYDIIKTASLAADRKQGVVHVE